MRLTILLVLLLLSQQQLAHAYECTHNTLHRICAIAAYVAARGEPAAAADDPAHVLMFRTVYVAVCAHTHRYRT